MARIYSRKAKKAGLVCGKDQQPILPGEVYFYSMPGFRSSWKSRKIRCAKHPFRPSELSTSLKSDALAAIESAQDELAALDAHSFEGNSASEVQEILDQVIEAIGGVRDAYDEAAENFGGGGPNGEARDEMEGAADELGSVNLDEFDEEGCEEHNEGEEGHFDESCDACQDIKAEWAQSQIDEADNALGNLSI